MTHPLIVKLWIGALSGAAYGMVELLASLAAQLGRWPG